MFEDFPMYYSFVSHWKAVISNNHLN